MDYTNKLYLDLILSIWSLWTYTTEHLIEWGFSFPFTLMSWLIINISTETQQSSCYLYCVFHKKEALIMKLIFIFSFLFLSFFTVYCLFFKNYFCLLKNFSHLSIQHWPLSTLKMTHCIPKHQIRNLNIFMWT